MGNEDLQNRRKNTIKKDTYILLHMSYLYCSAAINVIVLYIDLYLPSQYYMNNAI